MAGKQVTGVDLTSDDSGNVLYREEFHDGTKGFWRRAGFQNNDPSFRQKAAAKRVETMGLVPR